MSRRGRRPATPRKKKSRSSKHRLRREAQWRRRRFSARWSGGGVLEVESPRKKKEWG
jgi:hypothetical protein